MVPLPKLTNLTTFLSHPVGKSPVSPKLITFVPL